jgi:hypothetical protein
MGKNYYKKCWAELDNLIRDYLSNTLQREITYDLSTRWAFQSICYKICSKLNSQGWDTRIDNNRNCLILTPQERLHTVLISKFCARLKDHVDYVHKINSNVNFTRYHASEDLENNDELRQAFILHLITLKWKVTYDAIGLSKQCYFVLSR